MLGSRCLRTKTFISRKSINSSQTNVRFHVSGTYDEKSGTILEEKRDVPFVHRTAKHVRHPREAFCQVSRVQTGAVHGLAEADPVGIRRL